jgi:hypothetical protein
MNDDDEASTQLYPQGANSTDQGDDDSTQVYGSRMDVDANNNNNNAGDDDFDMNTSSSTPKVRVPPLYVQMSE